MDPYADAPSPASEMKPVDPYADTPSPSAPSDGPVMSPSQVDTSTAAPTRVDGPITSPNQIADNPPPAPVDRKFATSTGVRRFDPTFERYRGGIPIEYVRALVERESDGRPDTRTGSAIGLMQIVPVVLTDYNQRHGAVYTSEQLVDPAINVAMGCELLRLIVDSYRKNHPHIPNLQVDWNNLRFVELLTFGWNAGFSEAGGLGRVARYLEQLGAVDITIDQVSAHAQLAGASKHLSNPAKVAWCKSVVLYPTTRERLPTVVDP